MIAPVIVALTTSTLPVRSTNSARMNSAALPKVTFNRPPIAVPRVPPPVRWRGGSSC
jgi:hypothetical protein